MKQNTARTENTRYIQAKQDGFVWNVRNCIVYMKKIKTGFLVCPGFRLFVNCCRILNMCSLDNDFNCPEKNQSIVEKILLLHDYVNDILKYKKTV